MNIVMYLYYLEYCTVFMNFKMPSNFHLKFGVLNLTEFKSEYNQILFFNPHPRIFFFRCF